MENLQENINRIKEVMGILMEEKITFPIIVSDSFKGDGKDRQHAFQSTGGNVVGGMQTKVNSKLREIYNAGYNPDITKIKVTIDLTTKTTNWEVTIDESKDGRAYLGLITVGSCCNSTYSSRAIGQVDVMKTWNSKPKNHYLIADIQTTSDGKSNDNITIEGGTYKLRQLFYKYTLDNKPPHKMVKKEKPKQEVKYELDPRLKPEPASTTYMKTNYKKL